jgi:hypothetical protein
VLAQLLARDPGQRLSSAKVASQELDAIANDRLPECVRHAVEGDMKCVATEAKQRKSLEGLFRDRNHQPAMLARALQDLVGFYPERRYSGFLNLVERHAGYRIVTADIAAFQQAFVEQYAEEFPQNRSGLDAWKAVLKVGLAVFDKKLAAIGSSDRSREMSTERGSASDGADTR